MTNTNRLIKRLREEGLTYLSEPKLGALTALCRQALAPGHPSATIVEAGCALGGSAMLLAHLKEPHQPLEVYDTFDGIPEPSEHDGADVHKRYAQIATGDSKGIDGAVYYGYEPDLLATVRSNFERLGISPADNTVNFVAGDLRETLTSEGDPIAFAHLDVDWYESTLHALEAVWARLTPTGLIVLDDYGHWSGCRKATTTFLNAEPNARLTVTGLGSAVVSAH